MKTLVKTLLGLIVISVVLSSCGRWRGHYRQQKRINITYRDIQSNPEIKQI
ncbi:MAG: hypothetical protein KKA07_01715 [Bacteroidetes bacterium]|nr:hypothetical protein [Bacteroidota bacterium]MBU1717767.1 hypothetical protein [Bacteroidota bacterium]